MPSMHISNVMTHNSLASNVITEIFSQVHEIRVYQADTGGISANLDQMETFMCF